MIEKKNHVFDRVVTSVLSATYVVNRNKKNDESSKVHVMDVNIGNRALATITRGQGERGPWVRTIDPVPCNSSKRTGKHSS